MAKLDQGGFTFIELMLVMAITGVMLTIAFAGQRQTRARTQFDAAVNKIVATVGAVRAESVAGLNVIGTGTGAGPCAGASSNPEYKHVFSGASFVADSQSGGTATFTARYFKAEINDDKTMTGLACQYDQRTINIPGNVMVNVASVTASQRGYQILYVKTLKGGLAVCGTNNLLFNAAPAFGGGACSTPSSPSNILTITDDEGRSSQVRIDPSGLARRMN